jgi:hypothetical protein
MLAAQAAYSDFFRSPPSRCQSLMRPPASSLRRVMQEGPVVWFSGDSMRCSKCGSENPDGAKFCDGCAAPLALQCPSCGTSNRAGAKFCIECAAALGTVPVAAGSSGAAQPARPEKDTIALGAPLEAHDVPEGERKTVTALFADIKGSTELERDLDPEEARAIVDPVLQLMIAGAQARRPTPQERTLLPDAERR